MRIVMITMVILIYRLLVKTVIPSSDMAIRFKVMFSSVGRLSCSDNYLFPCVSHTFYIISARLLLA